MKAKNYNLEELSYKETQEINGGLLLITLAFMIACLGILTGVFVADHITD